MSPQRISRSLFTNRTIAATVSALLTLSVTTACAKTPEAATKKEPPAKTAKPAPAKKTTHPLPKDFKDTWTGTPPPQPTPDMQGNSEDAAVAAGEFCLHLFVWSVYSKNDTYATQWTIPGSEYDKVLKKAVKQNRGIGLVVEDGSPIVEEYFIGRFPNGDYSLKYTGENDAARFFHSDTGELENRAKRQFSQIVTLRYINNHWKCTDIGKLK